ncbi:MAG: DUF3794 and LysM peptidoglycan-binding domain-containing protein [Agathobaculum sp.]|jgi:hypothetical protein|uniref:DUF3794 and LysM peptidoglycan-binding domain-containing protein n=1 Tax=Agathobaculum sp. TaxID=2048138 RepID=UPI003D8B033A
MELNQTTICYYDKRLARISVCTESADSIVPDAFPDIGHVICAYGTAVIKDQTPQTGRLLISGTVQTTVLYAPEKGSGLRMLHVPINFAHIEECDGLDVNAVCHVCCRVASVEAVPVNSRKINVNAQLCFESECYCKSECTLTEQISLPKIEMLCSPVSMVFIEQAQSCPVTVLEDTPMQDAAGLQLLHSICTLRMSECRAMHGKVVLKGEADMQCLALQEDGAVRTLNSSTPFTQILEMTDAEEGDTVAADLAVRESDCRLEADGLLSYTISASALITLRRAKTIQQIQDLYLPGKDLQLQQEQVLLHSIPDAVPFTGETTETLHVSGQAARIIAADAICCGVKRSASDGSVQLTAAVQVLYQDDNQRLCAIQRIIPLSIPCAVEGDLSHIALHTRAAASGENGVLLNISAAGDALSDTRTAFRHITAAEIGEKASSKDGITLILRHIGKEQQLWEIAKSCSTTVAAIRRANGLPDDAVSVSQTMLLIPIQS